MREPKKTTCPNCDGQGTIKVKYNDPKWPDETLRCLACLGVKEVTRGAVPLDDLADMLAGDLPEGWVVSIHVERHAGWVEIEDPDGNRVDFDGGGEMLSDDYVAALDHVLERHAKANKEKTA